MANYLITGASSGIGKQLAIQAHKQGHQVFGVARRIDKLNELKELLKDGFEPIQCDTADPKAVKAVCADLPVLPDVVILNAGVGTPDDFKNFDIKIYKKLFDVNYWGAMHWVDELYPKFAERKAGKFVAVASLAAYRGMPGGGAYCASKGALSLTFESLRLTYRDSGVQFVTVHPGFVDTPMTEVNKFPMPFIWPAEKAAKYILEGINRKKLDISFPVPMRMILGFAWLMPHKIYQSISKRP